MDQTEDIQPIEIDELNLSLPPKTIMPPPLPPIVKKEKTFETTGNYEIKERTIEEQKQYIMKWVQITIECFLEHKQNLKWAQIKMTSDGWLMSEYAWKDEEKR